MSVRCLISLVSLTLCTFACTSGSANNGGMGGTDEGGDQADVDDDASSGDGDVGDGDAGDGDAGDGDGDGPSRLGVCGQPPPADFDPRPGYEPPDLAVTHVVTNTDDSGPGSLRDTITSAPTDAVIGFDAGLGGQTIALDSLIQIPHSMTIDGSAAPGLIIDGQGATRLFAFNGDAPAKIAFFSLHLANGFSESTGGAISVNGRELDFEVGGCTFQGNVGGEGGAIRTGYGYWGTKIYIHDSVFLENDGSAPNGNSGFSGGAVSTIGGQVHVARVRFEGNTGSVTGGLYTIHSNPLVEDSVFIGNGTGKDSGTGGFFSDGGRARGEDAPPDDGQIALERVRFQGNQGGGTDAGAAEAYGYDNDHIRFVSVIFKDNESSGRAGAAHIHTRATARISRTAFVDNHAVSLGGAIWADGSGDFEFENTLFSGNVSDSDAGGALRMNIPESSTVEISNSTFIDNTASVGGGVLWIPSADRDVRVTNSIFANNTHSHVPQINFPVQDDGGNVVWPDPGGGVFLSDATVADPMLEDLESLDDTWVRLPTAGSPAVDNAVDPSVDVDLRGASRSQPDIGAFEVDAACMP